MHMTIFSSDTHFLPLLLHDLLSFCNFITSHPLQCAYLLFFSPYILQLLLFLSPLLLSTSLLLLALLTVSPPLDDDQELPGKACRLFVGILKDKLEANSTASLLDNLTSMFLECIDTPNMLVLDEKHLLDHRSDKVVDKTDEEGSLKSRHRSTRSFQRDHEPILRLNVEEGQLQRDGSKRKETEWERKVLVSDEKPLLDQCLDKIVHKTDEESSLKSRHRSTRSFQRDTEPVRLNLEEGQLQREGSMRKEKEWKRTLACKLYEERMTFKLYEERKVVDGCEEMDLLWEAYEADLSKFDKSSSSKNNDVMGKKNLYKDEDDGEDDVDDDDEDKDESISQFCCLQALKLSTGKMNLGMRRPNLTKISNAMKGMGIFRRSRKHSIRKG